MKTLILLHGWGADGRIWHRQVAAFTAAGKEASRQPAPLPSPPVPQGNRFKILVPTIPAWEAAWLADFLKNLPLEDCLLVGWSLGGMLLLETLVQLGRAPGGLVLVGVAPVFCRRPDHPWGQPASAVRAMRRALNDEPARVLAQFAQRCLAPEEAHFGKEVTALMGAGSVANLAKGLDYLLRQDLRPYLSQLPGRPLIVQGDQDGIVPLAQGQFLQERIPGAHLHLVPGAGHLPFLTQAAAFNRILAGMMVPGGQGEAVPAPFPGTAPSQPGDRG